MKSLKILHEYEDKSFQIKGFMFKFECDHFLPKNLFVSNSCVLILVLEEVKQVRHGSQDYSLESHV